jgi:hypothetical protein
MNNQIQRRQSKPLRVMHRAIWKREPVTMHLPGSPVPVQGYVYRRRPLVLGVLVLLALGGGYVALHWLAAAPTPVQSTMPPPQGAHAVNSCTPDRVWAVVSHVGGVLHFVISGQIVQTVEYGFSESYGMGTTAQPSFDGPGFAHIDLMPFLKEGTNRVQIIAEHLKGRPWAGVRVTITKNERPLHVINQPWSIASTKAATLYDQEIEITVNKCTTRSAADTSRR